MSRPFPSLPTLRLFFIAALTLVPFHLSGLEELFCRHLGGLAPADASDHRKYAPDRKADILHLILDVTPDFKKRTVQGKATISFKPIAAPLETLRLDAIDLRIVRVEGTPAIKTHEVTDREILIHFDPAIPVGTEGRVIIEYSAEPKKGMYFRTPEMGYAAGDMHLFTQGEAVEARHWYPSHDFPNEKFSSEVICHVPKEMTVLSNGKMEESRDEEGGMKSVRWRQEKPHSNYLISLVAGFFNRLQEEYRGISMSFYSSPSDGKLATNSFRGTREMMTFFEKEIGVNYPWDKYDQVTVQDFGWGGMENTSITTLNDQTLFGPESENIRSSQGLVAHELAHQWFGDLVTCKDWSHIWLNEGFATYYAHLYDGHTNGRDHLLYGLYKDARGFINLNNDTRPVVFRKYNSPDEMFNYLAYPKGSWILHMLRSELGADLFRQCIKTYLERHQFQTVVTEDLNSVVEELSGRSFDPFFDQWVYHAHHPELEIQYNWDEKQKGARFTVRQLQKITNDVPLFQFPLVLQAKTKAGVVRQKFQVREKNEDFFLKLSEAPVSVRVDPDFTLLARIQFRLSNPMLYAQLADGEDMIGRLLALEQLAEKKDQETVSRIRRALNEDSFYGVRVEAARALRAIHTDEALDALLASTVQSDARVRSQVVAAMGSFYDPKVPAALEKVLSQEKNPEILAQAIRASGQFPESWAREKIPAWLQAPSHRSLLPEAAFQAARSQGDPSLIPVLIKTLEQGETNFPSRVFSRGLEAVAYLGRNEKDKSEVRKFLTRFIHHPRQSIQFASINALGTLADSQAVAILQSFVETAPGTPERPVAERALAQLAAQRPNFDELKDMRTELLQLRQSNQELQKKLKELERKLDASQPATATVPASSPTSGKSKKPASSSRNQTPPGRKL